MISVSDTMSLHDLCLCNNVIMISASLKMSLHDLCLCNNVIILSLSLSQCHYITSLPARELPVCGGDVQVRRVPHPRQLKL